ncbi:MAG: YdcF family protein [Clostridia bacterium]|nr:YdcF family protein [Clostridia bacterium]
MKKTIALLLLSALLTVCVLSAASAATDKKKGTATAFDTLLDDLMAAYDAKTRIAEDVKLLDDDIARSVADHWKKVYLDDYRLYLYGQDDPAKLPITGRHAFVVLGYELKNGQMTDELKGRCDAAAAAAKAFPDSILVCSGGATGGNNPHGNTEAGQMRKYLVNTCGIAEERIFTDKRAMTTTENAVNTLKILREQGVESMTIVTSSYHQRWGQVLYNAMAAKYRQAYGYSVEIIGNFCYDVEPSNPMFRADAKIAISQLKSILAIKLTGK